MKTVKLADVATISSKNPQVGDIAVLCTGKKVFVVSKKDAVKFNQKPTASYVFIRPTKISVDELMVLLPGILAFVPYSASIIKRFSPKALKELSIPDLSAETEFKKSLLADKAKIDEAGAALSEAQVNYDKAVESFIAYVKANLAEANKAE